MRINPFALHDLVAALAAGLAAVVFLALYWTLSRNRAHALAANMLACAAAVCLIMFLADNLVPAGAPARAIPGAALRSLRYGRWLHLATATSFALIVHFVACTCGIEEALRRHIRCAYAAVPALVPLIWSPYFLEARRVPLCETSDWSCAVPWWPRAGVGFSLFAAAWAGANLWTHLLLRRERRRARASSAPAAHGLHVASVAILVPTSAGAIELLLAGSGYVGITLFPVGIVVSGLAVTGALLRDAVDLRRWRTALERANEALRAESAERQRVEAERSALDERLERLDYLHRLRTALGNARSADEILEAAGRTLTEAAPPASRLVIRHDDRRWTFGATGEGGRAEYVRPIAHGGRERGELRLLAPVMLRGLQERVLVAETAGQIARALEAGEAQAQLVHSARLVSLGQMAAAVAHELKQPLSAISTTAGDIHLRLIDGVALSREELVEMMRDITGFTDRMAEIVDHLRVVSRDSAGQPNVPFSLNEVVRSGVKLLRAQLEHHDIHVQLELADGLPAVSGQPHQLEQVLLNLLSNARDALGERGGAEAGGAARWIRVRTAGARDGTAWVALEVEDNGAGMQESTRARIFEPFFTTKPPERGTGLGLSIAHAIVRNHEGRITCESRAGLGSVFRVALPVAEARR